MSTSLKVVCLLILMTSKYITTAYEPHFSRGKVSPASALNEVTDSWTLEVTLMMVKTDLSKYADFIHINADNIQVCSFPYKQPVSLNGTCTTAPVVSRLDQDNFEITAQFPAVRRHSRATISLNLSSTQHTSDVTTTLGTLPLIYYATITIDSTQHAVKRGANFLILSDTSSFRFCIDANHRDLLLQLTVTRGKVVVDTPGNMTHDMTHDTATGMTQMTATCHTYHHLQLPNTVHVKYGNISTSHVDLQFHLDLFVNSKIKYGRHEEHEEGDNVTAEGDMQLYILGGAIALCAFMLIFCFCAWKAYSARKAKGRQRMQSVASIGEDLTHILGHKSQQGGPDDIQTSNINLGTVRLMRRLTHVTHLDDSTMSDNLSSVDGFSLASSSHRGGKLKLPDLERRASSERTKSSGETFYSFMGEKRPEKKTKW